MKTIQEIREAAKTKLVGYTEKEIESFVQGAMFMAGNLTEKRSAEWYQKREEEKQQSLERSEEVCRLFQNASGLKKAVDAISGMKTEGEVIDRAFGLLFDNIMNNPGYRALMLDKLGAVDKDEHLLVLDAIQTGCRAFNKKHEIQLGFEKMEENDNCRVFFWDEKI